MNLKELTMEQHRDAERQKFTSILMSGKIAPASYLKYLVNQHACYLALETHKSFKLPQEKLKRSDNINVDIAELNEDLNIDIDNMLTVSTIEYVSYVENINKKDDFIAHVYVRYLGDLRGGQMIAKKIPGKGRYYDFENPHELANSIYQQLNDDMAEEAKKVFQFATRLFIEMYESMESEK
ncbi:MAG: hypothetical protein CMP62_05765 [Flavobacteriales bacterium]|nr:hypothetical protein [Flavobacteriales bacterium]|tara:strand:+ start:861 stop:1403 length:543 start_codon:yes stop_codon:yes gene_type:complete